MTFFGNIVYLGPRSVIFAALARSARAANDTTRHYYMTYMTLNEVHQAGKGESA